MSCDSGRSWWCRPLACLAVLILLSGLTAKAEAESQVLHLNWPSQRAPDTVVTEIEMTETQIIITLQFRNRSLWPFHPQLFSPGHPLSFYILEKTTGKRHYLAASQGLAVYPDYSPVPPGRTITFKLFFKKIPLASFSLMEGEPSLRSSMPPGYIFWDFLNIDLAKMENNFKQADRPPPKPDHVWSRPETPSAQKEKEPLKYFDNPPDKK